MIPSKYNDGPDVTYITLQERRRDEGGGQGRASQVAARYSLVAGSELHENSAECSTRRSANSVLTSIEMLNVARRWNKEPVLFSHLLALRGYAAVRIEAAMKLLHLPRMGTCEITQREEKHTDYAY